MNLCGCVKEQPQTFYHKKEDIMAQKILPGTGGEHYIPYEERTGEESVVYFTRDLSPEGLRKIYEGSSQRCKAVLGLIVTRETQIWK